MPPDAAVLTEARRWLHFAEDDLASARLHLATALILPNQACYHAQQAAEKALKATLIVRGVIFPKSHDLVALAALLPPADHAIINQVDLPVLTAWVVAARYPTDLPEATDAAAASAIAGAATICERVKSLFSSWPDAVSANTPAV
jgi:HEPN domain-containing protein